MPGLLSEKIGMTQIFDSHGAWVPVTVLKVGPCTVIDKRTKEKDGYTAIQLGYGEVEAKKRNKPYAGHFLKKNLKVYRHIREVRTSHVDGYGPGDTLTVDYFSEGDLVDVQGTSKGKGFQGVMKRHNLKGGDKSHGCSVSHRSGGSIGQRTWPGRVMKGKKMAGQMGGKMATVKNLRIVGVRKDRDVLLIRGSVPGSNHELLMVRPRSDGFEKRYLESKKKGASVSS